MARSILSHIVDSCPLTRLNNDLSRLLSADDDAVTSWLMTVALDAQER